MKKTLIAGLGLAAIISLPLAPLASAGGGYCSQPGCQQLRTPGDPGAGSQNGTGAGSGAFGAFGPGNPGGPADGTLTGLSNSSVSGSRTVDQPTPRVHPVPQNG